MRDVLGLSPDAVCASTLSRAYDTAKEIAGQLEIQEVIGDDRLKERYTAHFSGMLKTKIPKDRRTHQDVESDEVLIERFQEAIDELYGKYNEVVVVAHGGNIRYRLESYGVDISTKITNTSITIVDYDGQGLSCIAYGLADHLE